MSEKKSVQEIESEMRAWQTRKKRELAEARLREEQGRREAAERRVQELEHTVQQMREEIARLRGGQPAQQVQRPAVHGAGAPGAPHPV